jgi:hypothetical protein
MGLLVGFADRPGLGALADLEIAGRDGPVTGAGLDRAAAEQHLLLPGADRADHDLRVLIVDLAAVGADMAIRGVARGPSERDPGAAG